MLRTRDDAGLTPKKLQPLGLSSAVTIDSLQQPHRVQSTLSSSSPSSQSSARCPSQPTLESGSAAFSLTSSGLSRTVPATRSRAELEQSTDIVGVDAAHYSLNSSVDPEGARVRKRQRVDTTITTSPATRFSQPATDMKFPSDSEEDNLFYTPADIDDFASAGPSSPPLTSGPMNGYDTMTNGNSLISNGSTNGASGILRNGLGSNGKMPMGGGMVKRVNLPGTMLYDDGTNVDREQYVRLVLQSLRDVGYMEAAATLEAESGYSMESTRISKFKQSILNGKWKQAEDEMLELVTENEDAILDIRFLINQQKYLELIESGNSSEALWVLRNDITPLNVDPEELHGLSSLIMCSKPDDLRERAGWDGASGQSRTLLLQALHQYVPPTMMLPSQRMSTLLTQARAYQVQQCVYHNAPSSFHPLPSSSHPSSSRTPASPRPKDPASLYSYSQPSFLSSNPDIFSLYVDHQCDECLFPRITTTILDVHKDEVWNVEWSHDGRMLATGGKDRKAIIWSVGSDTESWAVLHTLNDHPYSVGCIAWSIDDTVLLTAYENYIRMWNPKTGVCLRTLEEHTENVTAMEWLQDGSGFISAALDKNIIRWDCNGVKVDYWKANMRIIDLAVAPDLSKVVVVGYEPTREIPSTTPLAGASTPSSRSNSGLFAEPADTEEHRITVYDLSTKTLELTTQMEGGELTSVKITRDSRYALISHSPDEMMLWDLSSLRIVRKFTGQKQDKNIIRSCYGGAGDNFVVSGSEDANVYVWHRDSGTLLEVLSGHGAGSVNNVSWNPRNERMFASCSDDHTIRIWEASPSLALLSGNEDKGKSRQFSAGG